MARHARRWRLRMVVLAALALAALSAFDPDGLRRYLVLAAEARRMESDNARLAAENARLAREAHALRTDPSALERAAREELRLVRPGERVYWVGDKPGAEP